MESVVEWSDELDALRFSVPGHGALCAMHRLAFKALVAKEPGREACLAFFMENSHVFRAAAARKVARLALPFDRSLHVNSRDIRRAMVAEEGNGPSRTCHVLDPLP